MRKIILILSTIFIIAMTPLVAADSLPDLGDPAKVKMTPQQEKILGREYMARLRASGLILQDPIDNDYLASLGYRLTSHSSEPNKHFKFFWFATPSINAFAGPNGYIGVNTGLFLASRNESELAGVMAHEVGHVVQGHLARGIAEQSRLKLGTIVGMLAAIALGSLGGSPDAAAGAISATVAGSQAKMMNYSRAHEKEADRVGMNILAKAQFDPRAMPSFFERMLQEERLYNKLPMLLNDHPLTQERIADTQSRADYYPKKKYSNSLSYDLVKERIRVQTASNLHNMLNYYRRILRHHGTQDLTATYYGYGLALLLNHKTQKALIIFTTLAKNHPNQLIFQLAWANTLEHLNQYKRALQRMAQLQKIYPDNYAVMIYTANILLKAKQPRKALATMEDYRLSYPGHPIPFGILSKAQAEIGDKASAYQTRANYLMSLLQISDALDQLKMALNVKNIDIDTKDRIESQIAMIEKMIKAR